MVDVPQACPLCGTAATYEQCRDPWGKLFECPSCIRFFIDALSEKQVMEGTQEARDRLQRGARSSRPGFRYVIRQPTREETFGDGQKVAREGWRTQHLPDKP